jgi:D-glycero-alpha-D-manno-heptose-7-phosphate kinase
MIIAKAPLRITLGGGGTDLRSYYFKHGAFWISAAIDKYIYISVHDIFPDQIILKYSELERVKSVDEIKHALLRESLRTMGLRERIEISSFADLPEGTGLGSSGAFTVSLLKGLHSYTRRHVTNRELAEEACRLEIEQLKRPVGKQDQYIAAFGGINCFSIAPGTDHVEVVPLRMPRATLYQLEEDCAFFFTGYSRQASSILAEQDTKSKQDDHAMIENLHQVKEIGLRSRDALEAGDLGAFSSLLNEQWEAKLARSKSMVNSEISRWFRVARENGASGGKLIGAGGGGFLMFLADDKARLRSAMAAEGLQEVRMRFDFEGAQTVVA